MKKLFFVLLCWSSMAYGATDITGHAEHVYDDCDPTANDLSVDSTTVYTGRGAIYGVYVNTVLSAHTVVIQDNTTALLTLPVSLAAGTSLLFPGVRFETSLVINPNDSSTGNITLCWKKL